MDHFIDSKGILQGAPNRGSLCRFLKPDYREEYIINMKIETQEQAIAAIDTFYSAQGKPVPTISDVQVLHSDSAICTIRFKAHEPVKSITHTIKIVGDAAPSLLE